MRTCPHALSYETPEGTITLKSAAAGRQTTKPPAPSPKKKALLIGINYDTEPRNDAEEFTYRPFTFPSNPHNNGDGFMYSSGENFIPPSDVRDAVTGPYQIYDTGRIQPMLPNPTGIVMPASARGWNISTAIHHPQYDLPVLPAQQPVTRPSMMSLDIAHVNPADTLLTVLPHGSIAPHLHVAPQINVPKRCEWENCGATLLDPTMLVSRNTYVNSIPLLTRRVCAACGAQAAPSASTLCSWSEVI
ncbi:hypothetical protein BKA93DRAFT_448667 [Sparassis latifolia]